MSARRVLVGGGSGFVGRRVVSMLRARGHEVTVVGRRRRAGAVDCAWDELRSVEGYGAVVNLAGAPILDLTRRWTDAYREECVRSRVDTTRALARLTAEAPEAARPARFVCASAVGVYPPSATAQYDEASELPSPPPDFGSRLCADVEAAAAESGIDTVAVRLGVVMGQGGGAFASMRLPFLFGLGAPFGDGSQPFPYVSLEDAAGVFVHAVETDGARGPLNAVAPQPATNLEFSRALASAMGRPCWPFGAPKFVFRLALGDRASLLVDGQRVTPAATLESGFQFAHPRLEDVARSLVAAK